MQIARARPISADPGGIAKGSAPDGRAAPVGFFTATLRLPFNGQTETTQAWRGRGASTDDRV
jgi:hypothetical protein